MEVGSVIQTKLIRDCYYKDDTCDNYICPKDLGCRIMISICISLYIHFTFKSIGVVSEL